MNIKNTSLYPQDENKASRNKGDLQYHKKLAAFENSNSYNIAEKDKYSIQNSFESISF